MGGEVTGGTLHVCGIARGTRGMSGEECRDSREGPWEGGVKVGEQEGKGRVCIVVGSSGPGRMVIGGRCLRFTGVQLLRVGVSLLRQVCNLRSMDVRLADVRLACPDHNINIIEWLI